MLIASFRRWFRPVKHIISLLSIAASLAFLAASSAVRAKTVPAAVTKIVSVGVEPIVNMAEVPADSVTAAV